MNATYLTKAHCLPPRKETSRIIQSARVCEAKYRKRYLSLSRDYPDPNLGTKCNRNTYYLCWSLNRGHLACKSNTLPIELKVNLQARASGNAMYRILPHCFPLKVYFIVMWINDGHLQI